MASQIPIVIANPAGLYAAAAPFDLAPPRDITDFEAIVRLTRELIGGTTATLEAMQASHDRTGQTFLCMGHGAAMRGYSGMLPMSPRAMPYLWMGQFDALDPNLELLARPGERIAAWWFWGIATVDHDAARQMIHGLLATRPFTNGLPTFARSATPAGRKIAVERMNFHPMRYPDDDLLWAPPRPIEKGPVDDRMDHAA
jgi:hypothetical protein